MFSTKSGLLADFGATVVGQLLDEKNLTQAIEGGYVNLIIDFRIKIEIILNLTEISVLLRCWEPLKVTKTMERHDCKN